MTREYSSISVATTLNSGINTTATTMVLPSVGAVTALLGGVTLDPGNVDIFTVAIDHDTVNEEIVFVTGVSGDTLTISRGQAGTGTAGVSGIAHNAGASIKHVLTSSDLIYFRNSASPVASFAFSGSTSGTTTLQATATAGTNTLTLPPTSNDTLVGRATTDTLTNKTINVASNTLTGVATLTGTETLTSKTLTSPTINTGTLATPTISGGTNTGSVLVSPEERTTIAATAATGTVAFDAITQSVLYFTSNASANWTLNIRGNSGTTLNSILATGDAITVTHLVTQGATAYYNNAVQIDGASVTPKWQNGAAPANGSPSSIDVYTYTIIKTASATYTVIASQSKFA
jgi:hypothetical protein